MSLVSIDPLTTKLSTNYFSMKKVKFKIPSLVDSSMYRFRKSCNIQSMNLFYAANSTHPVNKCSLCLPHYLCITHIYIPGFAMPNITTIWCSINNFYQCFPPYAISELDTVEIASHPEERT